MAYGIEEVILLEISMKSLRVEKFDPKESEKQLLVDNIIRRP